MQQVMKKGAGTTGTHGLCRASRTTHMVLNRVAERWATPATCSVSKASARLRTGHFGPQRRTLQGDPTRKNEPDEVGLRPATPAKTEHHHHGRLS